MDVVFENPGLCHIGDKIFKNLDIKTKFNCRLVRKSLNDKFVQQASKIDLQKVPKWSKFFNKPNWREFLEESKTEIPLPVLYFYLQNLLLRVINSSEEFNHRTPLLAFAATGNAKIVNFILQINSIRKWNHECKDALNSAAKYGHVNVVKCLKAYRNYAAILTASENGHLEVLKVLMDDITVVTGDLVGWKTIGEAAYSDKIELIKYFEKKLDQHLFQDLLAKTDYFCNTIFHNLAALGQLEMMKYLWQRTSEFSRNPIQENLGGCTPIHYAANKGHLEIVKFLASYTSNPITTNQDGRTPIYYAARNGYLEIVKFLALKTSNPNSKDKTGWTPSEKARSKGFLDIEAYLLNLENT